MELVVSNPFVAKADCSADEFSSETEDVESDVANPKTKIAEIYLDEVDPNRVDDFHYEVDSENVDSNLMVQTEFENEIKHVES